MVFRQLDTGQLDTGQLGLTPVQLDTRTIRHPVCRRNYDAWNKSRKETNVFLLIHPLCIGNCYTRNKVKRRPISFNHSQFFSFTEHHLTIKHFMKVSTCILNEMCITSRNKFSTRDHRSEGSSVAAGIFPDLQTQIPLRRSLVSRIYRN